jgi:hypothetical protein
MKKKAIIIILCLILFAGCRSIPVFLPPIPPSIKNDASLIVQSETSSWRIKLVIQEEGVYQISEADIQELTNGKGAIEKAELFHRGKPYPTWIDNKDRQLQLRFFAPQPDSRYTTSGIYWISFDTYPVTRVAQRPLELTAPDLKSKTITIETVFEEDRLYEPGSPDYLPWFWQKIPTGGAATIEIKSASRLNIGDHLRVRLWTKTIGQISKSGFQPHMIGLAMDNIPLGKFQWEGDGFHEFTVQINEELLSAIGNQILLHAEPLSQDASDVIWLDRIVIFQDDNLDHQITPIKFSGRGGNVPIILGEEHTIIELDAGTPTQIFQKDPTISPSSHVSLSMDSGSQYILIGEKDIREPDLLPAIEFPPAMQIGDTSPEYLIIGPREFQDSVRPLIEWRAAQGLKTVFEGIDEIVDLFGYGYPEPEAIHNYLANIYAFRQQSPLYVLLVGDFSHSRESVLAGRDLASIPSDMIFSELGGWTVSDTALVDFDQNGTPDLPIGRLPVRNKAQLRNVIQKIIANESRQTQNPLRILQVIDLEVQSFSISSAIFADEIQKGTKTSTLELVPAVANQTALSQSARQKSIDFIVYFGHGSLTQLGDPTIIDEKIVIPPTHPSILIAFTCLVGYFAHPDQSSLVETLLASKSNGIVAAIAPTSLTLLENQESMVRSTARNLANSSGLRLGDLFVNSLEEAWHDTANTDHIRTIQFFGDPALLIPGF